jgi:hypothetical protein
MPTTVIAPTMCGRKVPRSPSEPETSPAFQAKRERANIGGAAVGLTPAADLDVGENPCERPHIVNQVHTWRDTLLLQRLGIACGHVLFFHLQR